MSTLFYLNVMMCDDFNYFNETYDYAESSYTCLDKNGKVLGTLILRIRFHSPTLIVGVKWTKSFDSDPKQIISKLVPVSADDTDIIKILGKKLTIKQVDLLRQFAISLNDLIENGARTYKENGYFSSEYLTQLFGNYWIITSLDINGFTDKFPSFLKAVTKVFTPPYEEDEDEDD